MSDTTLSISTHTHMDCTMVTHARVRMQPPPPITHAPTVLQVHQSAADPDAHAKVAAAAMKKAGIEGRLGAGSREYVRGSSNEVSDR